MLDTLKKIQRDKMKNYTGKKLFSPQNSTHQDQINNQLFEEKMGKLAKLPE